MDPNTGRVDINKEKLANIVAELTTSEFEAVQRGNFEELWRLIKQSPVHEYVPRPYERRVYIECKRRFSSLWRQYSHYIKTLPTPIYTHTNWECPKGKRNSYLEKPLQCAIREFCEETGLMPDDINLCHNIPHFSIMHRGTNDIVYNQIYFIAELAERDSVPNLERYQRSEVQSVDWLSREEFVKQLRESERHKIEAFDVIYKTIESFA